MPAWEHLERGGASRGELPNDYLLRRALRGVPPGRKDLRGRMPLATWTGSTSTTGLLLHLDQDLTTMSMVGAYPDATLGNKCDRSGEQSVSAHPARLHPKVPEAELTCPGQVPEALQALSSPGLVAVVGSALVP